MKRIYAFDNLKALLIFCVVVGHLMEICTAGKTQLPAYLVIYSFHMPLFLLVSGFFGKFHLQKLWELFGLYAIFQILYLFIVHVLFRGIPVGKISFSLTTPYWLLWYLLVMIYYTCLIPLLSRVKGGWQAVFLLLCCVIGIAAGFFPSIKYYLSLSRFFCFLPFFVGGYFLGQRRNRLLEAAAGLSPKCAPQYWPLEFWPLGPLSASAWPTPSQQKCSMGPIPTSPATAPANGFYNISWLFSGRRDSSASSSFF